MYLIYNVYVILIYLICVSYISISYICILYINMHIYEVSVRQYIMRKLGSARRVAIGLGLWSELMNQSFPELDEVTLWF